VATQISFAQAGAQQPASAWIDAVRNLASRIASFTPAADALYLDFRNISPADAGEAAAVRRELIEELGRRGFHLSADPAGGTLAEVTLSESADGYLLVARVHATKGNTEGDRYADQTAIAAGPVRHETEGAPATDSLTLARKTVWEQRRPILDFANVSSGSTGDSAGATLLLLIVQPDSLSVYAKPAAQWVLAESAPLHDAAPWPRDLRGWIDLNNRKIELSGLECAGDLSKPMAMECAAANANGKFPRELKQLPLATGVSSGREFGDSVLLDINCGGGRVALVTGSGDLTEADSIQAFELKDESLAASGDPLPFAGPVLALWPSADLKSARVVARNLRTGMYEASIVSVTCGN